MELTDVVGMQRFAPQETFSPREHHEWAVKMWKRMDRDQSESITRLELDCEEFRSVLKVVLAPDRAASMGGVMYERAEMNMNQAISFCLRKADLNDDGSISFQEFEAFMRVLRQEHLSRHTSNLIFALFDLDGDQMIDESEFREIYRFYLGHIPTEEQFQTDWGQLDLKGEAKVSRQAYERWLQKSTNPIFKQHAPPTEAELNNAKMGKKASEPLPGGLRRVNSSSTLRPPWNPRLNIKNMNDELPQGQRNYFMRHQSFPELKRHYDTHRGFTNHKRALATPEPPRKSPVLSTDNGIQMLPSRSIPGGWMKNKATCREEMWQDYWQTPKCIFSKVKPGALSLRCLGPPPKWMLDNFGED